ncbi:hypothetical protein HOG47_04235 [archaeon]|jgi:hypothetical protein|nr:hypothetical protein [archaeon]
MKKIFLIITIITQLSATDYNVYKGKTLIGTIKNLNTIKEDYLKIKMCNFFAKMANNGNDYLIIYKKGTKPSDKIVGKSCTLLEDEENYITLIKEGMEKDGISETTNKNKNSIETSTREKIIQYVKDKTKEFTIELKSIVEEVKIEEDWMDNI